MIVDSAQSVKVQLPKGLSELGNSINRPSTPSSITKKKKKKNGDTSKEKRYRSMSGENYRPCDTKVRRENRPSSRRAKGRSGGPN